MRLSNDLLTSLAYGSLVAAIAVGIACSENHPTTPSGPPKLVFTTQPVSGSAGQKLGSVTVVLQDDNGKTLTGDTRNVTIGLGTTSSGPLTGNTSVSAVSGTATFTDLQINIAADGYRLYASAAGAVPVFSTTFDIKPGQAVKLDFSTNPAGGVVTGKLDVIRVRVSDTFGNLVNNVSTAVTLVFGTNPSGATLSGTTTSNTSNGVAEFSDLRIDKVGTGYTLIAQATGLAPVTSVAFNMRFPQLFSAISAGYFHTCGLQTDGKAYCWGQNNTRQIGNGSSSPNFLTPTEVSGGRVYSSISSGRDHTCALATGGVAYCWGSGFNGSLGNGVANSTVLEPTLVSGSNTFGSVFAGYEHTCAVNMQSLGYCWGGNFVGEVGDGSQIVRSIPTQIGGGVTFVAVSPGRYFSCGLATTGTAYCWGVNDLGELGDGTSGLSRFSAAPVAGPQKFSMVSAGGFHACGLSLPDGFAYCWGWNPFGQLGNGVTGGSNVPVLVSGGLKFVQISAGNRHTCGVTASGEAYCWGDGSNGMLGNGTTTNKLVPTLVSGGIQFKSISAGRFHTCGISTAGTAYCWGENGNGALGDGTLIDRSTPEPIAG